MHTDTCPVCRKNIDVITPLDYMESIPTKTEAKADEINEKKDEVDTERKEILSHLHDLGIAVNDSDTFKAFAKLQIQKLIDVLNNAINYF